MSLTLYVHRLSCFPRRARQRVNMYIAVYCVIISSAFKMSTISSKDSNASEIYKLMKEYIQWSQKKEDQYCYESISHKLVAHTAW